MHHHDHPDRHKGKKAHGTQNGAKAIVLDHAMIGGNRLADDSSDEPVSDGRGTYCQGEQSLGMTLFNESHSTW